MTVSSSLNRKAYTGDGVTTSFSTSPVVFYDSDELDVYVVTTATGASTTLTENTHYTVSGGSGSTGSVSLAGGSSPYGAPSASQTLVIVRTLDLVQEFDPQNNDGSDADNIETAFDKLTMMAQQNAAAIARSLRLADSDVTGASLTVPTPSASKLIGWDSAGTGLANYAATDVDLTTVSAFMETLLDDTSAATARTTLDAMQDVFTTRGDLVRAGASGVAERVALGASGTVLTSDGTDAAWAAVVQAPKGRITLTSGTSVTTADVTGASTVYYAPHNGNTVPIYNGTLFVETTFAELSQATSDNTKSPAAVANNSLYDLFVWNDAGTIRCTRGPAWSSDTARGTGAGTTELEMVNGILVNKVAITNGPAAQRGTYVGTIGSDGSAQINDSVALRHVWNMYNRVPRPMRRVETTDSWTYTSSTFQQARNQAANQLSVVRGLDEDAVQAQVLGMASYGTSGGHAGVGIGIDSSTVNSASVSQPDYSADSGAYIAPSAIYNGLPGIGRRTLRWLEATVSVGNTMTWYGDTPGLTQSGITGWSLG